MPGSHQCSCASFFIQVGAFVWFCALWTMLITWIATGKPHYVSMSPNQHVPFIFDIAADVLKLHCSSHAAVSPRQASSSDSSNISGIPITFLSSVIGGAGLILLSIFNVRRHKPFHDSFLLMFTIGVAVSVICTVIEYRSGRLIDFHRVSHSKRSFWMKTIVAGILITFAIVFAATESKILNVGCAFEWAVSLRFSFHLLKFYHDLRPENSLNSRDVEGVHKGEFSMMDHLDHLDHLDRTVDNETLTLGNVTMSRVVSRGDRGFYQLAVVAFAHRRERRKGTSPNYYVSFYVLLLHTLPASGPGMYTS
ncbi:Frag1/DRAM/Sfk1 family-domain-containing protein [Lentinula raphanica]|nr:Frag1/DRAM/Sfk1 family-domain-containing protein [Lentinula raphanica]